MAKKGRKRPSTKQKKTAKNGKMILALLFLLVVAGFTLSFFSVEAAEPAKTLKEQTFSTQMAVVSSKLTGNFDLEIYDVADGKTFSFESSDEKDWYTASIVKVSILAELLSNFDSDGSDFDEDLTSEVQAMIRESDDNSATDILLNQIGNYSDLDNLFGKLDMTHTSAGSETEGWGYTTTTANDQILQLKNIFLNSKILSVAQRAYIQNEMENVSSDQQWGISAFSRNIKTLAIKDGWGIEDDDNDIVDNSIGSVTLKNGQQYLIAALGDGFSDDSQGIANQEKLISAAGKLLTIS